jgi:hypothetical protein
MIFGVALYFLHACSDPSNASEGAAQSTGGGCQLPTPRPQNDGGSSAEAQPSLDAELSADAAVALDDRGLPLVDAPLHSADQGAAKLDQAAAKPDHGATPAADKGLGHDKAVAASDKGLSHDHTVSTSDSGSTTLTGTTYYVRPSGGTAAQCTGLANADYPGSGTKQACAFSHPFIALPPGGTAILKGGNNLVIASGSYQMGLGAAGASTCSSSWSWDCNWPAIPSGTDASHPTRILGEGWDTGCASPPSLFGVERAKQVIDLSGSSNVDIECLEITDHEGCVEMHSSATYACNRSSYPYGKWAQNGLRASDSENVTLKNLDIHGMANRGVLAGRLKDWTLYKVRIAGNGWAGWDGDLSSSSGSSNSGTLLFRKVTIEWNGCGETYPGGQPTGCWGQTAGGYGDGLGTAATGGDWIFEDSSFLHNTSDGLDLLYHSNGGTITVDRVRSEGNSGNPLKLCGNATVTNSVIIANCAYFAGQSFTYGVDHCRAMGNAIEIAYTTGAQVSLTNNTVYGEGDVLVDVTVRTGNSCNGKESLVARNNIFVGGPEYHSPGDYASIFYADGCSTLTFDEDYGVIYGVKNQSTACPIGTNDLCADPKLPLLSGKTCNVVPASGSPAIDSGKAVGGTVPALDILWKARPYGSGVDRGAYEVGSTTTVTPY